MNISSFNNIIQKSLSDDQENVMKGKLKFTLSRVEFYKRTRHKRFSSHFECDRQCLCYNDELLFCHRIRKDFTAITPEERWRFSDALKIAATNPIYKDEYRRISNVNARMPTKLLQYMPQIFLPWHSSLLGLE